MRPLTGREDVLTCGGGRRVSGGSVMAAHLRIESGPEQGREIVVPPEGVRLGRADGNEVVLKDPALSRFHCRIGFKAAGGMYVSDLASTNETLVNDQPTHESLLQAGDRVTIGETVLRVVADTPAAEVDLGFSGAGRRPPAAPDSPPPAGGRSLKMTWLLLALAVGANGLAVQYVWRPFFRPSAGSVPAAAAGRAPALELDYEKVQASPENIFRYALELRDDRLAVTIHDLENNRQVVREKAVNPDLVRRLGADLTAAGFFDLQSEYAGLAPDLFEQLTLAAAWGDRSQRVRVRNRIEPDAFRRARELIEEFARNELGLTALDRPPEKLRALAEAAWQQGQKLFAERLVREDNLYRAIQAFRETEWYLETIEPKPDYFAAAVAARQECERLLQEQYDDALFRAEREIKLRNWAEAQRQLRRALEAVQDRGDTRYQEAYRKLLDVQRRLPARGAT